MLTSTNFWAGILAGVVVHMAWQRYRAAKASQG